jgi:hypothetical protein
MAVVDAYVHSSLAANTTNLLPALQATGASMKVAWGHASVAAADEDGSVYRVFKSLPAGIVIFKIEVDTDSITSGTDYDIGLHETDLGAVVDKDVFTDGDDWSTGANNIDGMQTLAIENRSKQLFEHAGHTVATKKLAYDLTITANTVGSAAGDIIVRIYFVDAG